jgi:hypothetical protein
MSDDERITQEFDKPRKPGAIKPYETPVELTEAEKENFAKFLCKSKPSPVILQKAIAYHNFALQFEGTGKPWKAAVSFLKSQDVVPDDLALPRLKYLAKKSVAR